MSYPRGRPVLRKWASPRRAPIRSRLEEAQGETETRAGGRPVTSHGGCLWSPVSTPPAPSPCPPCPQESGSAEGRSLAGRLGKPPVTSHVPRGRGVVTAESHPELLEAQLSAGQFSFEEIQEREVEDAPADVEAPCDLPASPSPGQELTRPSLQEELGTRVLWAMAVLAGQVGGSPTCCLARVLGKGQASRESGGHRQLCPLLPLLGSLEAQGGRSLEAGVWGSVARCPSWLWQLGDTDGSPRSKGHRWASLGPASQRRQAPTPRSDPQATPFPYRCGI